MVRVSRAAQLMCVAALLVVVGVVAGPTLAARTHSAGTKVTVTATEFKFKLSKTSVPAGTVTFAVVNKGKISHDFSIAGKKTPLIKSGKSAILTVTLKAGKYPYKCTVLGHAKLGMKGTLTVS